MVCSAVNSHACAESGTCLCSHVSERPSLPDAPPPSLPSLTADLCLSLRRTLHSLQCDMNGHTICLLFSPSFFVFTPCNYLGIAHVVRISNFLVSTSHVLFLGYCTSFPEVSLPHSVTLVQNDAIFARNSTRSPKYAWGPFASTRSYNVSSWDGNLEESGSAASRPAIQYSTPTAARAPPASAAALPSAVPGSL